MRFVSASAVGFYGDRGDEELTETSTPGTDFLSDVVRAWEAATQPAVDAGASVVFLRTGIVMAPEGGAMSRCCRWPGLGRGTAGLGPAVLPWITLQDEVRASCTCSTARPHRAGQPHGPQPARQREIA